MTDVRGGITAQWTAEPRIRSVRGRGWWATRSKLTIQVVWKEELSELSLVSTDRTGDWSAVNWIDSARIAGLTGWESKEPVSLRVVTVRGIFERR
jgi:hypothetical protein